MELRWVLRSFPIRGQEALAEVVRVLQYREREGPREDGWWGDWKDVPIADSDEHYM
jgi:hypothetical protein